MPVASRVSLVLGAVAGGLAVVLGAFGAHGLEGHVSPGRLGVWRTAVDYHFYHALALIATGLALQRLPEVPALRVSCALFVGGILTFSGSLYALVLTDTPWLGAVAPVGGIAFILAWAFFAWGVWRAR